MPEENQRFTVSDKRMKIEEPSPDRKTEKDPPQDHDQNKTGPVSDENAPPDFSSFILSLGTSCLMHLGENPLPGQKKNEMNLPHAKEVIDLLSLLEEKTRGNLTRDESNLLSNLLYTLRMKFVELKNR